MDPSGTSRAGSAAEQAGAASGRRPGSRRSDRQRVVGEPGALKVKIVAALSRKRLTTPQAHAASVGRGGRTAVAVGDGETVALARVTPKV